MLTYLLIVSCILKMMIKVANILAHFPHIAFSGKKITFVINFLLTTFAVALKVVYYNCVCFFLCQWLLPDELHVSVACTLAFAFIFIFVETFL